MRRVHVLAAVLGVAVLAAGGVTAAGFRSAAAASGRHDAGQTCLGAATAAAQAIFSYDYKAFDASVANGKSFTTGDFTAEYTQTTSNLKTLAVQQQAVVRAEVSAAGVVDVQPGRVELLLYVNQYRRNTAITGEKVDQNRVVLTMVPTATPARSPKPKPSSLPRAPAVFQDLTPPNKRGVRLHNCSEESDLGVARDRG